MLCIGNLSKIWPTWKATKKSVAYASKYYGKTHHQNTPANAFRHAVWNYLIIRGCYNKPEQLESGLSWAKKITDIHEELFQNDELAKIMDLHNNRIGRKVFSINVDKSEAEMIEIFREMTRNSLKINSMADLKSIDEISMIHMVDFPVSDKEKTP